MKNKFLAGFALAIILASSIAAKNRIEQLALTSDADAGGFQITGLGSPTNSSNAATLGYVTNQIATNSGSTNVTTVGTITNGVWNGTPVALGFGGTGGTNAVTARANLGLGSASTNATGDFAPAAQGALPTARIPQTVAYVFEGDSMTAPGASSGSLILAGEDYPAQLMTLSNFTGTGTAYNQAIGGQPISTLLTQYAAQVYPHRPAAEGVAKTYLFLWTFNNDYDSRDESAIWSDWESYVTTARADGFTIVALTVPKRRPPSSNGLALQNPSRRYSVKT